MMKIITRYFISFLLLFNLAGCSKMPDQNLSSPNKITPALEYWRSSSPYSPVAWIEADLDNDSRLDTVIIYREAEDKCMMCAVLNAIQGFTVTQSTRAPLENQVIQHRDIDKQPPVELMVSGSKNGKFGYAIFRLDNDQLIDLFAEGMNDCC